MRLHMEDMENQESEESKNKYFINWSIVYVVFSGLIMYGLLMLVFLLAV